MSLAIDPKLGNAMASLEKAKNDEVLRGASDADADGAKIKQLSRDFEAIFVGIMLKSMRQAVPKSGFLDGGNAEDLYRSMLDAEYAQIMSQQQQTGLAKNIEEFLLRAQGKPVEGKAVEQMTNKTKGLSAYQAATPPTSTPAEQRIDAIVSRLDNVIKE